MRLEDIEYTELESLLRNWPSVLSKGPYDFVGMFHLFRACLLNLVENSTEDDWLEVIECLEPAEREFLSRLVGWLQRS